jgi:hypothetical protein
MSENMSTKNTRDDEIDLMEVLRRLGQALTKLSIAIGRGILRTIVFLIRKWIPLSISIIIGLVLSRLTEKQSISTYSSDMTLRCNGLYTSDVVAYVNRLHQYSLEKNKPALKEALSLSDESVGNIVEIGAYWIIDLMKDGIPDYVDYRNSHNVYDTLNIRMHDRLDVRVRIVSPQELSKLRDGIVRFIENDSLFQQRNRVRMRQNAEMIRRLDYDIKQLDSLQKVKYFEETRRNQTKNGGQIVFLQEQKTQLIYDDIYNLYNRKNDLELDRDLYSDIVTVFSDFSIPAKRENSTVYYGRVIIPLTFCLTLLLLVIIENRKKIKEIYRKY